MLHFDLFSDLKQISACNECNVAWWSYGSQKRVGVKWRLQEGTVSNESWCVRQAMCLQSDGNNNKIIALRQFPAFFWGTTEVWWKKQASTFWILCLIVLRSSLLCRNTDNLLFQTLLHFYHFPSFFLLCFSFTEPQLLWDSHWEKSILPGPFAFGREHRHI